ADEHGDLRGVAAVIDSPASAVYDQTENRLHAQKAVLALTMGGGAG
ncbi:MAG TPA: ornithine carbamoyltransferase, partial [Candidatus Limnocylindria bacterium]